MRLLFIVLAICFTNLFSQDIVSGFQESDSLKANFSVTSELPYGMSSYKAAKDSAFNGIGNYQIKFSRDVYVRGCCVGNAFNEYQLDLSQLYLHFDRQYEIKIQYYFYSGISYAYERNRYIKFRTPAYDDKIKNFLLQVRFNEAGGVSLKVDTELLPKF